MVPWFSQGIGPHSVLGGRSSLPCFVLIFGVEEQHFFTGWSAPLDRLNRNHSIKVMIEPRIISVNRSENLNKMLSSGSSTGLESVRYG
jgi:hypothetical protein